MRRYRLGPEYGIPLSYTQQAKPSGTEIDTQMGWKSDVRVVIADGGLLIRQRLFKRVMKHTSTDRGWIFHFGPCLHRHSTDLPNYSCFKDIQRIMYSLEAAGSEDHNMRWSRQLETCTVCASEWQFHLITKQAYQEAQALGFGHGYGDIPLPFWSPWLGKNYLVLLNRYLDVGECRQADRERLTTGKGFETSYNPPDGVSIKSRFEAALCEQE
jgi:hypothetical protein